jgi:cob(I)alamin adenosyltransferase
MSKKVYTKTGDNGTTTLLGGTKVPKDDWRLDAYGTVDELNSFIGLLADRMDGLKKEFDLKIEQLEIIQDKLFRIGSLLSYDHLGSFKMELKKITLDDVEGLELWIDEMQETLPELKNFILPGGDEVVSLSHVCRTVCRRAERRCAKAIQYPEILIFLNRLSDYFFVLSRYTNHVLGYKEKIWKG